MSKSLKSNILYIQSDGSSDGESAQKTKKPNKLSGNEAKPKFGLFGSHRLNNQAISKGLFHNTGHQQQYKYEALKLPSKLVYSNEIPKIQIKKNFNDENQDEKDKTKDTTSKKEKHKFQLKHSQSLNIVENKPDVQKTLATTRPKLLKSKTILFQFNSQSESESREEQNQQQQTKIQTEDKPSKQKPFFVQTKSTQKNEPQNQKESLQNKEYLYNQIGSKPQPERSIKKDRRSLNTSAILLGRVVECTVVKKNQLSNFLYSQYDMFLRHDQYHLLSCKKFFGNFGSNYRLSQDQQDFTYLNQNVLGKVRSSTHKQVYNIYDSGVNPTKTSPDKLKQIQVRQILATVRIHITQGPRSMEVYVLKQSVNYYDLIGTSKTKQVSLEYLYNIKQNQSSIYLFKTRKPEWIPQFGQYYMNFGNRIHESSIRNFILEDPVTKTEVLFFGKYKNGTYHIDISHPLSPLVGLAIAVPQLDRDD